MEDILRRSRWKYGLLSIILLNAFDGIATYIGLEYKFYVELNGFLNLIYSNSSLLFFIIKIIIPTILILILVRYLGENLSEITRIMILIVNMVYICICIYHIVLYTIVIIG